MNARRMILVACCVLGLSVHPVQADSEIKVGIVPEAIHERFKQWDLFTELPRNLASALNRTAQANFRAAVVADVPDPGTGAAGHVSAQDYYVRVKVTGNPDFPSIDTVLYNREGREIGRIEPVPVQSRNVTRTILDALVVKLGKNVRIVVLEFQAHDGSTQNSWLASVLPDMLIGHLKTSPRLVLLDSFSHQQQKLLKSGANERSGVYARESILKLGDRLRANYVITGEYTVHNEELYVHARCVSLETGEILAVEDLLASSISIEAISRDMARWAAELRSSMEDDFLAKSSRARYLAVTGFPPDPDSSENQEILIDIVRTISRKLKSVSLEGTRVRENIEVVRKHVRATTAPDRWSMSAELEADFLLSVRLDRTERDRLHMTVEGFDPNRPGELQVFRSVGVAPDGVEEEIENLIDVLLSSGAISLADRESRAETRDVAYHGIYKPFSLRIGAGLSSRRSPDLYLGIKGGLSLDVGIVWKLRRQEWQWEVVRFRLDLLSQRRDDRSVFGLDVLTTLRHSFRPHYSVNPYVGITGGLLGVSRIGGNELVYDAVFGAGIEVGVEHTTSLANRIYYSISHDVALEELRERTIEERSFDGGYPGGTRLTMGYIYEF